MEQFLKNVFVGVMLFIMGFNSPLQAQTLYKINASKGMNMKLSGTSTLHNWYMNSPVFTGEAQFGFVKGSNSQLTSLTGLTFSLRVLNLKSDSKKLDKNAYKALKTDQYKEIVYKQTSATVSPDKSNTFLVSSRGNLTIAGVTKEIAMDVYCTVNSDASITCKGSEKLKMTDYGVKPPSFMLGAMKAGNDITLEFTMIYDK